MKRVSLTYRKTVNLLEQDGRIMTGSHAVPLDDRGTVKPEIVTCDWVDVQEFCIQMKWGHVDQGPALVGTSCVVERMRAVPLDLLFSIEIEEV